MNRFDALASSCEVKGLHFLEASAGTGKTFAIEHLVTRLIMEDENPLCLEEILITTFTNAATRELKSRIRATLEEAKLILSHQKEPTFAYLEAILQDEDKAKIALYRIEEALFSFERAQIFTLHGFCHRTLSEFAFHAKTSFSLSDPKEEDYKQELLIKIKDFLRSGITLSPRQLAIVMKENGHDVDKLSSSLFSLIEKERKISRTFSFLELHSSFQKNLSLQKESKSSLFVEDFLQLGPCYKKLKIDEKIKEVKLLGDILEKKTCSEQEFDELLKEKEFFLETMDSSHLKQRAKIPTHLHYPGFFEELRSALLPKIVEAKDPLKLFLLLAKQCQESLGPINEEKISFDALLKKMQEALKDPDFVAKVRGKYKASIVDEFQDTDPVQWSIFSTLFLHEGVKALYLVGDPKQSIYAFRNANLYTYLEAKLRLGKSAEAYLDTNYRSEPKLVEALNTLFSFPKQGGWLELPSLKSEINYRKVLASPFKKDEAIPDDRGSVHCFVVEESRGREKKWPSDALQEDYLFPFIAKEIWNLKKKADISFSKIAVLTKDRYQGEKLFAFLKEAGIPSKVKQSVPLVTTLAFSSLLDLIDAALHIGDLSKAKKLFAGPFFGLDHLLLRRKEEDALFQEGLSFLCELQKVHESKGFMAFFNAFLHKSFGRKTILENLVSKDDLNLYLDLKSLSSLIVEEEAKNFQWSLQEVFFFLKDVAKKDQDSITTYREEEGDKVEIMTTHASKGLEFDIVFALGIAYRHKSSDEWVVVREEEGERIALVKEEAELADAALKEIDAEKQRLLYVALTRARKRVYIPYAIDLKGSEVDLGEASPIELFCHKMGASGKEIYSLFDTLSKSCSFTYSLLQKGSRSFDVQDKESQELVFSPLKNISFKSEWVFSFSSLKNDAKDTDIKTPLEIGPDVLPIGADTGNTLHRILERYIKGCKLLDVLVCEELKGGPLAGWEEVVINMVEHALQLPLPFKLSDIPKQDLRQEMEFLLPFRGSFLKGFIDLVFLYQDKYYLLDWKSNYLGPNRDDYSDDALKRAMVENEYYVQAAIYALALERYVKLFDKRPWEECFGGAIYLFLRGEAAHCFMPDFKLLDKISNLEEKTWEE